MAKRGRPRKNIVAEGISTSEATPGPSASTINEQPTVSESTIPTVSESTHGAPVHEDIPEIGFFSWIRQLLRKVGI